MTIMRDIRNPIAFKTFETELFKVCYLCCKYLLDYRGYTTSLEFQFIIIFKNIIFTWAETQFAVIDHIYLFIFSILLDI